MCRKALALLLIIVFIGFGNLYSQSYLTKSEAGFYTELGLGFFGKSTSAVLFNTGLSINRSVDISFNFGVNKTTPENTNYPDLELRTYSITVAGYPMKQWEGEPFTGQVFTSFTKNSSNYSDSYGVDDGNSFLVGFGFIKSLQTESGSKFYPKATFAYAPFVNGEARSTTVVSAELVLEYFSKYEPRLIITPFIAYNLTDRFEGYGFAIGIVF